MYCPKCGKENPEDQRYCRSCGLSLQNVSQAISDVPPVDAPEGLVESVGHELRAWRSPLVYAGLLLVVGFALRMFAEKVLNDKSASDIGTIIALIGVLVLLLKGLMLVAVSSGAPRSSQDRSRNPSRSTNQDLVASAERTTELSRRLLQPEPASMTEPAIRTEPASVTERTTRQLDTLLEEAAKPVRDSQPGSRGQVLESWKGIQPAGSQPKEIEPSRTIEPRVGPR